MMVLSAGRYDAGLLEFLAARARSSSALRLAGDVAAGAAVLTATLWWSSAFELAVVSAAVCLIAYGAWGLLERAEVLIPARWKRLTGLVEALAALTALTGVLGALGVLLSVWALALGTWIS